jgi:hypothetical protein
MTHYIDVREGTHLEVSYNYYRSVTSNDYEIEKIELVSDSGVRMDITSLTEDLLNVLRWDKINEEIFNQHN